jgi:sugar lactone lactonase YvrE
LTDTPPQLPSASYRYSQKTGAVFVVDDTLQQPNGIALNSDHTTLYISDTGEH